MTTGIRDQRSGIGPVGELGTVEELYGTLGVADLQLAPRIEHCTGCGKPTLLHDLDEPLCNDCFIARQRENARLARTLGRDPMTRMDWFCGAVVGAIVAYLLVRVAEWMTRGAHWFPGGN